MRRRTWVIALGVFGGLPAALLALVVTGAVAVLKGCRPSSTASTPVRRAADGVDDARLRGAAREPRNWLTHGGDYAETRYSTLEQINEHTVKDMGLEWSLDMGTMRGLEATPIVVDGMLFTTGAFSVVYCVDARSGLVLWRYDPRVPGEAAARACCDAVNRGVAVYRGRVYVGTLDGRLIALDAATGALLWEQWTVDRALPYTITGAPRVVKGMVMIGNGGADFGVRGYISAYDAESGRLAWRFYTVPGDPSMPFESRALERAASTWNGEWWKIGGGGTVWDSMAYDPDLDLVYVGTGNGSPWNRHLRSPGGGDNLYLSSILALRPDVGELVWHYQTTPGESWDYAATQHIILADVPTGGVLRKVLLQAPKNGFFYVLDRVSGQLLSAQPFVHVTWARGIDLETGRPIETAGSDYRDSIVEVRPSQLGGHNWQPMAFHPRTKLVYIPAQEMPQLFARDPEWSYQEGSWNTGVDASVFDAAPPEYASGHLLAWDPVGQREVWRAQYDGLWNGGVLATAGNLVFQGTGSGELRAYRATDGELLWKYPAHSGIVAPPVTYLVDGTQYVSVMAGWGGAFAVAGGAAAAAWGRHDGPGRLLTFRLGGTAKLTFEPQPSAVTSVISAPHDGVAVARGKKLFHRWCSKCHGVGAVGGGVIADLRRCAPAVYEGMPEIVLGDALRGAGMPSFGQKLDGDDVGAIRAYLLERRAEFITRGPES